MATPRSVLTDAYRPACWIISANGSPPIHNPAAIALASSSVEHVSTRSVRSLSSAASTLFWCVSGTLAEPAASLCWASGASVFGETSTGESGDGGEADQTGDADGDADVSG